MTIEEGGPGSNCTPLAATSLEIRAGCSTFSIANNYTIIEDIVKTIDRKVKTVWNLPPDLKRSLIAHGQVSQSWHELSYCLRICAYD